MVLLVSRGRQNNYTNRVLRRMRPLCRLAFTEQLHRMHRRTVAKHPAMKIAELENAAHEMWSERQAEQAKRRKAEPPRLPCPACEAWARGES